ncbi:MAG: hypothetical protein NTU98_11820 [Bacteroidetes bacterium]|nr:hypothetical protein [Bacteroidota bacterium]
MKKEVTLVLILFAGFSSQAFAGTGSANDGLELLMVLAGFLLLVVGFFEGIDYLHKNGKVLVHRVKTFIKNKVPIPPKLHFHTEF